VSEDTGSVLERIRRIAEEGMRRAQPVEAAREDLRKPENAPGAELNATPAATPPSQPARSSSGGPGASLGGEITARRTACTRLRKLLADGRWHSALELVEVGGLRYGGRLHEIRRGQDGAPALDVECEAREQGGRQVWFYRAARAAGAAPRPAEFPRNFESPGGGEKSRG